MRYMIMATVMVFLMISLITWAARPDLFNIQYDRAAAPVKQFLAKQRAAAWQAAKDQAWEEWRKQVRPPKDCPPSSSSLRTLECQNAWQVYADHFERDWADKVASGWHPEGVD